MNRHRQMFQKIWGVIFFLAFSTVVWAYDFEADGIYYNILSSDDKTVEVTYKSNFLGGRYSSDYSGDVSIPATVTHNGIEYRVTAIGFHAFDGCKSLTSVTIDDGVTTIGSWAFGNCDGLTSVTIPEGVTSIGNEAFLNCDGLTEITIPESVTTIGEEAFDGCEGLTSVTIPDGVTTIGWYAFSGCTGLKSVTIPESVTSIGDGAFSWCRSLKSVTIPDGVTTIGWYAFSDCTGLTSVTIPDGVTTIGWYAFSGCEGLTSVTIPDGVTTIGCYAFHYCTGLTSITIPESVTSIGSSAFSVCRSLKKFEGKFASDNGRCLIVNDTLFIAFAPKCGVAEYAIPNSVTTIDYGAFSGCTGLTSVTIPESVTTIDGNAFFGCTGLTEITIPNNVTSIGSSAFYGCTGLTSVTIPVSVISIGSSAFYGCTGLRTITSLDTIPPSISGNTFDNETYKNATVNYPKGSLHAYKTASGWENFTYNYPLPEQALNPQISSDAGETTCRITVSYTRDIEYPVWRLTFRMGEEQFTLDTAQTSIPITITDLEPQTEYEAKFFVETKYGDLLTCETSFTTDTVKLTTQPAINISNTSATLTADIACDAVIGAGFEWRREDAPELVPSTLSETPIVDGKISGTLRNLSQEKYYKYRPFYRTVKGKYYYGKWLAFGTLDVYAYFEPTVSTRSGEVHGNNSTISGYIVEGSDELLSQGFEYWAESPASRSTESIATRSTASNPERIVASGSLMSVTLTGLDYNTTYYYRAYATTAKKTTYGNTESFTTGKAPVVQNFKPATTSPADSSEIEALKTITLIFTEKPALAAKAQTITLAGNDTLLTATLSAGSGNRLVVTLADTLKVLGEYTLTIPEGAFGDADFADDPTVGHCNPELVYTFTITEPEPAEPDEPENPENPDKPDEPVVPDEPDEPASVTETQAEAGHIAVYNLQGVLVLETDDAAALKTLQNGAYIVNGKKMIIVR